MWIFFALASTLLFSFYDVISRVLAVSSRNPVVYSGLYNLMVAALALLLFLFEPFGIAADPLSLKIIALYALGMFSWSVFARVEFVARKLNEASRMKVIFRISPIVTFFLAILFLGEPMTVSKVVALVLTAAANVLVMWSGLKKGNTKSVSKKGVIVGVIAAVAVGVGYFFDKLLSPHFTLPFYTFSAYFFPGMVTLLIPPVGREAVKKELKKVSVPAMMLLALIAVTGFYVYLKALALADVSSVVVITSTSSVLAILLGIIVLKEREDVAPKIVAGALVLVAAIVLS